MTLHDVKPDSNPSRFDQAPSILGRASRIAGVMLIGALLAVVCLVAVLACRPCGLTDWVIDSIYKNVADPIDREMPVTITSYPASPQVVAVLGGKGEGLDCSIPWFVKPIFPTYKTGNDQSRVERRFRQACVFHDLCYRHGLATYGYTQNDCDRMLHEQAFRICAYLEPSQRSEQCQLDAKKVLAGVTFGGAWSFKGWEDSTYYEFDPNPEWSDRFTAVRVVDNPFKPIDPVASKNDPDQLMLTFDIKRAGVEVNCVNCEKKLKRDGSEGREFSEQELREAGLKPNRDDPYHLGGRRFVWLPPRDSISAPHLLVLDDRNQALLWVNRRSSDNSIFCFALVDPKNLLTSTIPSTRACNKENKRLEAGAIDLFSSSPQPVVSRPRSSGPFPRADVLATAISPQNPKRLCGPCASGGDTFRIVNSPVLNAGLPDGTEPGCDCLATPDRKPFNDFGIFQNLPIIKGTRQIYLSRGITDASDAARRGQAFGLRALVFDVEPNQPPGELTPTVDQVFDVPEQYDPMVPVARNKDDFRLLNVIAAGATATLFETDLKNAKGPQAIALTSGADRTDLVLHRSWVRRPIQVVELAPQGSGSGVSQLILSRSLVSAQPESVVFEFLVLQRGMRSGFAEPYSAVRSARCRVDYSLNRLGGAPVCKRLTSAENESKQTLRSRLQGAQLVVGKLTAAPSKDLDLAVQDVCWPEHPIILRPNGVSFSAAETGANGRITTCDGGANPSEMVLSPQKIAADIVDLR
jgi:hypothetical protein